MPSPIKTLKLDDLKRSSGNIGATAFFSIHKNNPSIQALNRRPPYINGCLAPKWCHSIIAAISEVSASIHTNCPGKSNPLFGCRALSISRMLHTIPVKQMGILTKKIIRQLLTCISNPPSIGPAAMDTPPAAVHKATARARLLGSCAKFWFKIDRELGIMIAEPIPCSTRKPTRLNGLQDKPQPMDARPNTSRPSWKSRFAPSKSLMPPAESISTAKAMV